MKSPKELERENYMEVERRLQEKYKHEEKPWDVRERVLKGINERRARELELEASGVREAGVGLVATEKFRAAYAHITEDPMLYEIAKATDRVYVAAGDDRDPWDRYQEIGDRLTNIASSQDAIDELAITPPDDIAVAILRSREKTPSEIVADMEASRYRPGKN